MSSLFGSGCVSSCPAELSVEIRLYMPLCGGDVPSGKGGTNAGGAGAETQKQCVCMKLPAARGVVSPSH